MPVFDQSGSEPTYRGKMGEAVNLDEKMALKTQLALIDKRNLTVKSFADSVWASTAVS